MGLRPHLLAQSLAVSVTMLCGAPVGASAAQSARLSAHLTPEHLGSATTVSLAFVISGPPPAPAALQRVELGYPSNLGFATSGLGVAACLPGELELLGEAACPPDSRMGAGSAKVEIPIGPEVVREDVTLELFAGPSPDGYLHILVYAAGTFPVIAHVVLAGVLLPGRLRLVIPPIPSLPDGPYVSVTQMQMTLGGRLTYYERVGARRVAYHPPGVGLPRRCPRGGFAFSARFAFIDGGVSDARTAVPCPRR